MGISYRQGRREDSPQLAELIDISSGGVVEYLYQNAVPGDSPVQILTRSLERDRYPLTYRNAIVAEHCGEIAGMVLSFPSRFHGMITGMNAVLPHERIEHMRSFYEARVEGSWYIDSLGVYERFRRKRIATGLIERAAGRAGEEGYRIMSLIVFADNIPALNLYRSLGFQVQRRVELGENELIPHTGGCLLLRLDLLSGTLGRLGGCTGSC